MDWLNLLVFMARGNFLRALHAQIVVFVHFLLELAFATNCQDVVFHADVQILWIDFRQIGFDHQLMLSFVDVHCGRPGSEAGFLAATLEVIIEQPIDVILQGSGPAEGFPTSKCSHVVSTSVRCLCDCIKIIKYERLCVKSKFYSSQT